MKLGDEVKDKITGFTGIVTQRNERLDGATQCAVQSKDLNNGIPVAETWFNETRLELLTQDESIGFTAGEGAKD